MKLYNKTKYPDDLLEQLLTTAGKSVGARTANVIAIATSGRQGYNMCKGTAWKACAVRRFALGTRVYKKGTHELKEGVVTTDGGYFTITLPCPIIADWVRESEHYKRGVVRRDNLAIAELIFGVATHEWEHIKQYQEGTYEFNRIERRKNWKNRSWEKDAIKASNKARSKPKDYAQEAILDIALYLDEINKPI
jgi:hypothetical protein